MQRENTLAGMSCAFSAKTGFALLVHPEYQVGHSNYAKYFEENSPVFIGVLEVLGAAGGLTCGFGPKLRGLFFVGCKWFGCNGLESASL